MEPVTEKEVQRLVDELDLRRKAWINGHLEITGIAHMVQAHDMTLFGSLRSGDTSDNSFSVTLREKGVHGAYEDGLSRGIRDVAVCRALRCSSRR